MGKIGVNITISLVAISNCLLLLSMATRWKHMSFFAGVVVADTYLLSVRFTGLFTGVFSAAMPQTSGLSDSDFTGNMTGVRDIFCGIPACRFCSVMCDKFTIALACGVGTISMFMLTIIVSAVACGYLCYHMVSVTKREYRLVAYRCLVIASVTMFLGLFFQLLSLFYSLTVSPHMGSYGNYDFPSVITPTSGFFLAIMAFFLICVAPCLNTFWVLPTKELVDDEKRQFRRENRELLRDSNPFNYGATAADSRAFYAPSKFGSATFHSNEGNNQNIYPSLAEPYTLPEPHDVLVQTYQPYACTPPDTPNVAHPALHAPGQFAPDHPPGFDPDSPITAPKSPPGFELPEDERFDVGFDAGYEAAYEEAQAGYEAAYEEAQDEFHAGYKAGRSEQFVEGPVYDGYAPKYGYEHGP